MRILYDVREGNGYPAFKCRVSYLAVVINIKLHGCVQFTWCQCFTMSQIIPFSLLELTARKPSIDIAIILAKDNFRLIILSDTKLA